jgi:hypothetical protein
MKEIWLYIGEKYNNCLLIDMASFRYIGGDKDRDLEHEMRHSRISFSLIDLDKTMEAVAELKETISKKLTFTPEQLEKFVYMYVPKGEGVPRIVVNLYSGNQFTSPPNFEFRNDYHVYAR